MINVLSLFDGMSCGRIALDRAKIPVGKYYASEIDKYAIQVSQDNYPDIERLGDVIKWREWPIDWASIDLLLAGSPCQGFSFAGKQLAFDDPRSALFFLFVDILNHIKLHNPKVKFLLENVRMKKEFLAVISEHVGVEPVFINSNLVSAQNRPRFYWANWQFALPKDRGLFIGDIVQKKFDKKYIFSDKRMRGFEKRKKRNLERGAGFGHVVAKMDQKSGTIPSRYYKDGKECVIAIGDGNYRQLSTVEVERLQTLDDGYTSCVSDTQAYKMLGNGWTVDVIAHILKAADFDKNKKIGPCAKRTVQCTIIGASGKRYVGSNACTNPQKTCPKADDEGYEKCKTICGQIGHAEEVALAKAGDDALGAKAILSGHSYFCISCQHKLFGAGVEWLKVNKNAL